MSARSEHGDDQQRSVARGFARRLHLARLALFWERLWPAAWPAVAVAGFFVVLALFDILPLLPGFLHALVLAGFAVVMGVALWHLWTALAWPDAGAGERRIEAASGLRDRPLVALRDALASGRDDPGSQALWQAHQVRMRARIRALRVGIPRPGLAQRDPWAIRGALLLILVIALVAAGADGPDRLARAAKPDFSPPTQHETISLELWVTPPAHTRLAPLFLDQASPSDALSIPVNSTVLARLHGGGRAPNLTLGESDIPFSSLDAESYQAEGEVTGAGRLAVRRGGTDVAGWDLSVIPDAAPIVQYSLPPQGSQRAHLRLSFFARDDYGVEKVRSTIRRTGEDGEVLDDEGAIELDLALPGLSMEEVETTTYHDLTPHPWAGLPVTVQLTAEDAIGQTGVSEAFVTVLPARLFQHPVARVIIEERRKLTLDASAENRRTVAYELRELAVRPGAFHHDKVVFLALVTASARLMLSDDESAMPRIQQLLWDTALRIEDGELSLAERDLRIAQEALMEALAQDASDEEIEALIDALRDALDRYLQALAENMMENPSMSGEQMPFDPNAIVLEFNDLRDLLEQAREMARSGAREAAKDLLAQFQDILENMQPAMRQSGQAGQGELNDMLRNLSDLIRQQQNLLDQTYQQWQQSGRDAKGDPSGDSQRGAATQEDLRRQLGDLMRRFGERYGDIPEALGDAEGQMRRSEDALKRSLPGRAVRPQSAALDKLREGGRIMARGQQGMAQGPNGAGDGFQRDPLGRPMPGFGRADTENVDIPDISDVQRARQILDELRRRAGERDRPQDELEYIDRLLRRF